MTFVVRSFGKTEKGNWFLPHKQAPIPTIASSSFQFVYYSSWHSWIHQADNLIMPVTWSCVYPQLTPSLQPSLLHLHFLRNVIHVTYMLMQERKTVPFPLQIHSIFLLETWRTDLEVFHIQWHQLLCFRISTDMSMNLNYSISSSPLLSILCILHLLYCLLPFSSPNLD